MMNSARGFSGTQSAAGARVAFVLAHQDDEIAYLGRLRHLVKRGRDIHVVWITDGARWVPAGVRRWESLATMGMLGLFEPGVPAPENLHFWEYPDGGSLDHAVEIVNRLTVLMSEIRPEEVYTVAYEGGHPDHDFAHFASVTAAMAQDRVPSVYEAPLYNSYGARLYGRFGRFVPAETETMFTEISGWDTLFKLRAMLNYRSQFWIALLPGLLFGGRVTLSKREPYRPVPDWSYFQPPHSGRLFYENIFFRRFLGIGFEDFRKAVLKVAG